MLQLPLNASSEQIYIVIAVIVAIIITIAAIFNGVLSIKKLFESKPGHNDKYVTQQQLDEVETNLNNQVKEVEIELKLSIERCATKEEVQNLSAQLAEARHYMRDSFHEITNKMEPQALKLEAVYMQQQFKAEQLAALITKVDQIYNKAFKVNDGQQ